MKNVEAQPRLQRLRAPDRDDEVLWPLGFPFRLQIRWSN